MMGRRGIDKDLDDPFSRDEEEFPDQSFYDQFGEESRLDYKGNREETDYGETMTDGGRKIEEAVYMLEETNEVPAASYIEE